MKFKLQRRIYGKNQVFTVNPSGYDHGRGFLNLAQAFDYMRAILTANK